MSRRQTGLKVKTPVLRRSALIAIIATGMTGPTRSDPAIRPDALSQTVKALASDSFAGRAPGTIGETRTVHYLIHRFEALGMKPGGVNGAWTQPVSLVHTRVEAPQSLEVTGLGAPIAYQQAQDLYVTTLQPVRSVAITSAPLVFVGYGVTASTRGRDDYKGTNLEGKIAVILMGLPPPLLNNNAPAQKSTQTVRWTYKFDEAARHGAMGAILIHETPAAGIDWSTAVGAQGEGYDLLRPDDRTRSLAVRALLRKDAAVTLFRRADLDFDALQTAAARSDFKPVELARARFQARFPVAFETVRTNNVLARWPGAARPDETVMISAHWDAFGVGAPDETGQTIRRGANDDALGVAGVLEIARALSEAPAPRRSVVFALWTAEERGLLGSEAYGLHPVYPLEKTVADLNIDILQTAGLARDVILVGAGEDSLDGDLARAAQTQGRRVSPDPHPERGIYYRSDHFNLAKRGVPSLVLLGLADGPDLVEGGKAAGDRWLTHYVSRCYHKPCDAWSAAWDLRGAAQDLDLLAQIARDLANSTAWPTWSPESELQSARSATDDQRR